MVSIQGAGEGPAYLTVSGWSDRQTLGSCATDTFSGLGGRVLAVGDELSGEAAVPDRGRVGMFQRPVPDAPGPVRVMSFGDPPAMDFFERRWTVRRRSRSGVRLASNGWTGPATSIESMPVIPGTIQVTPDGEAIVLGPDGGLTGGYPVVGVIASVDLDRMSLPGEGESITFTIVDTVIASAAYVARRARFLRSFANPRDLA